MLNIAFANLDTMIVLAILAGSLMGSTMTFLARRPVVDDGPFSGVRANPYGYERPKDWPIGRPNGASDTASDAGPRRRVGIFAWLMIAVFAVTAGWAGYFSYQSPWSTETDLRHLVASVHCEAAALVGLSGAERGAPGYQTWNDTDRNGIACEVPGVALALNVQPVDMAGQYSDVIIGWPAAITEAAMSQ